MRQGQTRRLRVQAVPDAPVSFLAVDNGRFTENTLPAITVRTDAQGVAEVTYEATPGVINEATIMCSCPMTTGRVRFAVFVAHDRTRTTARRSHEPPSAAVSAD